jgi:hypothetical protein
MKSYALKTNKAEKYEISMMGESPISVAINIMLIEDHLS